MLYNGEPPSSAATNIQGLITPMADLSLEELAMTLEGASDPERLAEVSEAIMRRKTAPELLQSLDAV